MNIKDKVLSDLEIYNKILPKIDFTITKYGTEKMKKMLKIYSADHSLTTRQRIINNIINSPKSTSNKLLYLKKIKKLEKDIDWFFNEDVILSPKKVSDDAINPNSNYADFYFRNDFLNIKE